MIRVDPISSDNSLSKNLTSKIATHLKGLNGYEKTDKQKLLELCQVGKALALFFPDFEIKEVREEPDFIISNKKIEVGIEHELIVNVDIKKQQGFYENIFHLAERDLQKDNALPNFLANCYLKSNLNFKTKDKNFLVDLIKGIIRSTILNGEVPENPLIAKILHMPHSKKNLSVNFGAHIAQYIKEDTIRDFIKKKENKIGKYKNNTGLDQWLLLITGGVKEYSYEINEELKIGEIDTKFKRIFLLADFDNKLYQLK